MWNHNTDAGLSIIKPYVIIKMTYNYAYATEIWYLNESLQDGIENILLMKQHIR